MDSSKDIKSVSDIIQIVSDWEKEFTDPGLGSVPVWYRGHADLHWELQPTVLREWFITRVNEREMRSPDKLQQLISTERTINNEFRRNSASHLHAGISLTELYFIEQHHGMPTRLLDWTANALVALFFSCCSHYSCDACVYAINPRFIIPNNEDIHNPRYPWDVISMNHPIVSTIINNLYGEGDRLNDPFIVPINPNQIAGRLLNQNARFTLHPPASSIQHLPVTRIKMYRVPAANKPDLILELRRIGVSWATLFPDLDHVAQEIRTAWRLYQ